MNKFALMEVYITVCEQGSFSAAAESLGLYPSRISQQIKTLENHLNTVLIKRNTRALNITDKGKEYLQFCKQTLGNIQQFENNFKHTNNQLTGKVKITVPPRFATLYLTTFFNEVTQKYPQIHLEILASDTTEDLIGHDIDLAIRSGKLSDSRLVAKNIYRGRKCLYAANAYLNKYGAPLTPCELSQHQLLLFMSHQQARQWHYSHPEQKSGNIRITPHMTSSNASVIVQQILLGLGIGRLSDWAIDDKNDELIKVLPDYNWGKSELNILYPKENNRRTAVTAIQQLLETSLQTELK